MKQPIETAITRHVIAPNDTFQKPGFKRRRFHGPENEKKQFFGRLERRYSPVALDKVGWGPQRTLRAGLLVPGPDGAGQGQRERGFL
ncbi:hypothetical protein MHYP_G00041350 [Metynnis hypsauchen]